MMKKLITMFSLLTIILLIISGCGVKTKEKSKETNKPVQQGENKKNQDYKIGKDSINDKSVLSWQEELADQKGVFINNFDQYTGVLIGLGEKTTGGYSVKITEVKELDNKWVIKYEEVSPPKGSFVTQVLNNVFEVVYLPNGKFDIEVYKIENGKETKEKTVLFAR